MPIRSALINGICLFEDVIETAVRELAERTKITHTNSLPTYTRNLSIQSVLINGMCLFKDGTSSRNGGERISAELDD